MSTLLMSRAAAAEVTSAGERPAGIRGDACAGGAEAKPEGAAPLLYAALSC
jgi:hypothetical protein